VKINTIEASVGGADLVLRAHILFEQILFDVNCFRCQRVLVAHLIVERGRFFLGHATVVVGVDTRAGVGDEVGCVEGHAVEGTEADVLADLNVESRFAAK
jgi:hypothetical protein